MKTFKIYPGIYVGEQEYIVLNTSEKYIAIDINTIANTQNLYK